MKGDAKVSTESGGPSLFQEDGKDDSREERVPERGTMEGRRMSTPLIA